MRLHHLQRLSSLSALVTAFCLLGMSATPAQANPLAIIVNIPAQTVIAMSATNMLCVSTIYDENGNRLSQTVTSVTTTTTTWGAASYGCFVWKQ